ncbi:S-layer homology domain-containing protein [Leptolyngbya sp. FACHB-261]|uniref:S-layer homology domain-containing protein n=1 Tax=Leptolyngbya sp. FACHB-261 TaxID=2692806 RepID=UPI00168A325E|nr:S-layer homology domain-containing protein [Leptolyngbya sp. FACHB-261]MBD2103525.1 hypothetical protein [Leptolyngbya sp. FACHB-261]
MVRSSWRYLLAFGLLVMASALPAQAQTQPEPAPVMREGQPTAAPVEPAQPLQATQIRRSQAPLPLATVYQTPISQFEPPFTDVPTGHWAYEAVTRLFYSGILRGQSGPSGPARS